MTMSRRIITWFICGGLAALAQLLGWGVGPASGSAGLSTRLRGLMMVAQSPTQPPVERHVWEKQIPFAAGGEIEIENAQGRILVREGAPGQIHLAVDGTTTPVLADDLKLNVKKSRLSLKCASSDRRRVLDLHVAVPPGARLRLKTDEGTVQVHARARSVHVETLSGDVVLGVPVAEAEIEITWTEGYVRYGGPELQRPTTPATAMARSPGPLPARLVGQFGSGRVQLRVRTLNGWVEIGNCGLRIADCGFNRVVIGAAPPQPLSRAARAIARSQFSSLGEAIRTTEPRLEATVAASVNPQSAIRNPQSGEDVVQLEAPLVNLNASVTDAEGKVISGLRVEDFTVTEDGVKQPITHFATETTPFNLVLLLDVSGSTRGKIELIRQAARRFLDLMHPSDKIALLLFARDVEVVAHLTSDREALRRALEQMSPPLGSTALYDAIGYALVEELDRVRGERNAVVVVTDGRDSSLAYADTPLANDPLRRPGSFLRFSDLLVGVRYSDVVVYPIAIENEAELAATLNESGREQVRADSRRVREQFQQLADISGGRFYRAAQLSSLDGVYEQIATDLRTIYSLAYAPARAERDGQWRRVEVRVARPGARVRCPRGYFAR